MKIRLSLLRRVVAEYGSIVGRAIGVCKSRFKKMKKKITKSPHQNGVICPEQEDIPIQGGLKERKSDAKSAVAIATKWKFQECL